MADLKKRGEEAVGQKIQGFRFPREKASAKKPYWILLSEDQFFPVLNTEYGGGYLQNYVTVKQEPNRDLKLREELQLKLQSAIRRSASTDEIDRIQKEIQQLSERQT